MRILGIGDMAATQAKGEGLKTLALGSSVALTLYDPESAAAGMAHVALPSSQLDPKLGAKMPGYFADTAVPALLRLFMNLENVSLKRTLVKLTGAACLPNAHSDMDIGWRTAQALTARLADQGLTVAAQDLGKTMNRSVSMEIGDGSLLIYAPGRGMWSL